MFKVIMVISCLVLMSGYKFCITDAAPIQNLPHKEGFVPVYIRIGDTPLNEIHPGLAEAFHETDNDLSRQIIEKSKDTKKSNEIKREAT